MYTGLPCLVAQVLCLVAQVQQSMQQQGYTVAVDLCQCSACLERTSLNWLGVYFAFPLGRACRSMCHAYTYIRWHQPVKADHCDTLYVWSSGCCLCSNTSHTTQAGHIGALATLPSRRAQGNVAALIRLNCTRATCAGKAGVTCKHNDPALLSICHFPQQEVHMLAQP